MQRGPRSGEPAGIFSGCGRRRLFGAEGVVWLVRKGVKKIGSVFVSENEAGDGAGPGLELELDPGCAKLELELELERHGRLQWAGEDQDEKVPEDAEVWLDPPRSLSRFLE